MAQDLYALFLPPNGFENDASARLIIVGDFAQMVKDDLDDVFFQSDHGDFNIDVYYTHANVGSEFKLAILDDRKTIKQDDGVGNYFTANLIEICCATKNLKATPTRDDKVVMEGVTYTVDSYEEIYDITTLWLKVYK